MPNLNINKKDSWAHFIHLYTQVIKDISLVIKTVPVVKPKPKKTSVVRTSYIKKVTVNVEIAPDTSSGYLNFRVLWTTNDSEGKSVTHTVSNSFAI